MKKNILITHVHMRTGGIETSLVNLLSMLDKNKYNVDLILYYPDGNLLSLIPDWVNIIPVWNINKNEKENTILKKIIMSRNNLLRLTKNIILTEKSAKHFIPNKEYDCAFAYSGYFTFTDMIAALSNAKKKYIWVNADFYTQYNIDKNFRKKFEKIYKKYKFFDKIVCVSKKVSENLKLLCPEYENKIIYQWTINKKRELQNVETPITLNGKYNIITIARLDKYKGVEKLIRVAKNLKDRNIDFKLYVLGDGPYRKEIEKLIREYNLSNYFILLGNIENVFSIISQADLYVSPSECEGFPSVVLECLIGNIPIVATPTAGAFDIYTEIAPKNAMLLTKDFSEEAICNSIIDAHNGTISKEYEFDIDKLNNSILTEFKKKLL